MTVDAPPKPDPALETIVLDVAGMKCAGCVRSVETQLKQYPGVIDASVNLVTEVATVGCQAGVDAQALAQRLSAAGFPSQPRQAAGFHASLQEGLTHWEQQRQQHLQQRQQQLVIALVLLAVSSLGHITHALGWSVPALTNDWLHGSLAAATLLVPGRPILVEGWQGLRRNAPNMNTLIGLGTLAAFVTSLIALLVPQLGWECFFSEPVMLIAFILLGRSLEQYARQKAASGLQALAALQPKVARVVGKDRRDRPVTIELSGGMELPIDLVHPGDWVGVLPGETIPVDGTLVLGETTVDESMLTGEAVPLLKQPGDRVSAGSLNQTGAIGVRVDRVGRDVTLAQIIQLVETAQARKAPIQNLADTVAAYFTYGILIVAALTFSFWLFWGSHLWPDTLGVAYPMAHHPLSGIHREAMVAVPQSPLLLSLKLTIGVLVVACPCALGLATPTALLVGSSLGAQRGLLIRGGDALQQAAQVDTLVFDKTGTLTLGQPQVTDVVPVPVAVAVSVAAVCPEPNPAQLLQLAATVEAGTRHPLAVAIAAAAQAQDLDPLPAQNFRTLAGSGVSAHVQWGGEWSPVYLGTCEWLQELGIEIPEQAQQQVYRLATDGKTVVLLALNRQLLGWIAVMDSLRPEAAATMKMLQHQGMQVMLLTGDRSQVAQRVAQAIGIASERVLAEVKPAQKAETIARLQASGHQVGMIGDGINDAPALAQANVGMALQGSTDVAAGTADILLMRNSLTQVVAALTLSRATFNKIRQNLFWAFFYNAVAVPVAAGALLPHYHFILTPSMAGGLMALSSISVVTNSLLLQWQLQAQPRALGEVLPSGID
jgi:Cu2+-exporting ATPase